MAVPVTVGTAKSPWTIPLLAGHAALTEESALMAKADGCAILAALPTDEPENGKFLIKLPTAATSCDQAVTIASETTKPGSGMDTIEFDGRF